MHESSLAESLPTDDELQNAFIGKNNTSYYRLAFARMQQHGTMASGWNWVAFFFTSWWLIYRRLWSTWFAYQLAWILFIIILAALRHNSSPAEGWVLAAGLTTMFVLPAWRANAWYYNRALREIVGIWDTFRHDRNPRAAMLAAAKKRGTASVLQIIGFLGAIVIFSVVIERLSRSF
jgi:hypothetical protein